jgi:hypothetical protein
MRKVFISILICCASSFYAQSQEHNSFERKGFTFGLSTGAGILTLSTDNRVKTTFTISLPNLRIGYMANQNLAIQLWIPGALYKLNGKDRSFEGLIISGQYWLKDKWWALGGIGMTLDAPAFWTVENTETADFNIGFPALALATGYEIWRIKNFAIDIQYHIYAGQAKLETGKKRQSISHVFSIGFNLY